VSDDPDEPRDPSEDDLLPGEPSGSGSVEQMRHWIDVYRELLSAKRTLMEEIIEQRRQVEPPAKVELDNDRKLIQREADRLARRLQYWEQELRRARL
jgi:hypothetical protein